MIKHLNKFPLQKLLLIVIAFMLVACERDDICPESTPTTPRLLVEFYDSADPETIKSVLGFTVYGEGLYDPNAQNPDTSKLLVNNANTSAVALPLIIGEDGEQTTTRYIFERDSNTDNNNIDILEITYTTTLEFVSRACGFKAIFTDLQVEIVDDEDNWMNTTGFSEGNVNAITVENEADAHVFIFH
ncbi:DUF6452 family protein [Winogradskyella maritima]|uniref:DUF6452 family protein n=1 Tax=Winogradskyella maritima TaxID=1517766 RepID=A0ABV8AKX7_9FLAO|nr:DUF6452 family protein [Winogradskyella maritima]